MTRDKYLSTAGGEMHKTYKLQLFPQYFSYTLIIMFWSYLKLLL